MESEGKRKAYSLPDEECTRLRSGEMDAVKLLLAAQGLTREMRDELKDRMRMIPDGPERMDMIDREFGYLCDDLVGTINRKQAKQIYNFSKDYAIRTVPRLMPGDESIKIRKKDVERLVMSAMQKCVDCMEDDISCRDCELYGILLTVAPLPDYDNGLLCPYSNVEVRGEA